MEKADHARTASYGNDAESRAFHAAQKALIDAGNFRGAVMLDVQDIASKFPNGKYAQGTQEMLNYVNRLFKSQAWRFAPIE